MNEYALFFTTGCIGALVRLVADSGCLVLPRRINGTLVLGFIGSMVVGGFVGCVVDGEPIVAAFGGYIGVDLLDRFMPDFDTGKIAEVIKESEEK